MTGKAWGGRHAQRLTALTLSTYGTVCWLCGHDGADSADHILPRSRGGSDAIENLRPAHYSACATCGKRCNQARGNRLTPATPRRPYRNGVAFLTDTSS